MPPNHQRAHGPRSRKETLVPALSPGRRRLFRWGAATLLPVMALVVAELVLRVAGAGYPTSFFLKTRIDGHEMYVENQRFGFQFFPRELARSPSPLVMPAVKAPGTCRIFILGESAALGDPEPAFGFGRYLQALLGTRYPGTRFEVVCTAMTAINSHAILPIARECARHEGDIWVVYMGNNEFVGPFGASSVFGTQAPRLSFVRLSLLLKQTRIGQLLARLGSGSSKAREWGGMKMFLESQVAPDDPRKERVYANFQQNLADILKAGRRAGVKVVLSTVASNLKDCAPFASRHRRGLTTSPEWDSLYQAGIRSEQGGNPAGALSNFLAAAKLDSFYADLQFRLGRDWLALTNRNEAQRSFQAARDCDALPFRADTRINEIIRRAAGGMEGVQAVDFATALAAESPDGLPGREALFEHVHLNFAGNYLLARTVADQVRTALPESATRTDKGNWASADECNQQLALTDWDRRRVLENMLRRLGEAPFINQLNHGEQIVALSQAVGEVRKRLNREAAQQAAAVYEKAIAAASDDFLLPAGLAKLREDTGDFPGAVTQWERVCALLPLEPGPWYFAGKALARAGKPEDALRALSRALALHPGLVDALDEKGSLLVKLGRPGEGLALLEEAARIEPQNARLCLHRAEALAVLGRRPEAVAQLREAVRLQPANWEARYLLGVELAMDGSVRPAAEQFLEVIRLNPNHALARLNLGIALAKLDRTDEAIVQFEETLRLDPNNQKAAEYLRTLKRLDRQRGGKE